jgi:methylthioribose-1-phosphate isomerase
MEPMVRSVFWQDQQVMLIDQRLLPWEFVVADFTDYRRWPAPSKTWCARRAGHRRGGGVWHGPGAQSSPATDRLALLRDLETAAAHLNAARPTAVNLAWGTAACCAWPPI